MAMKKPRKPVKGQPTPVANIGLGNIATRKQIEAAVLKYLEQKSYSERSAELSKRAGTSPSAGTRSVSKPEPVFYKTDKFNENWLQKQDLIANYFLGIRAIFSKNSYKIKPFSIC